MERRIGSGRVLVWTSTLDLEWNDLALKPVFLPFVHQLGRHLAAYREPEPWLTVGEVLIRVRRWASSSRSMSGPWCRRRAQRIALDPEGGDVVELQEQGFYELRGQARDRPAGRDRRGNVDLSESDLTPMDPKEVVAAVTGAGRRAAGRRPARSHRPTTRGRRRSGSGGTCCLPGRCSWPPKRSCRTE